MDEQAPQSVPLTPNQPPDAPATTNPILEQIPVLDVAPVAGVPQRSYLAFWIGLIFVGVLYVVLFSIGGEPQHFARRGRESLPFLVLAMFAYASRRYKWAKVATVCYLLLLAALAGLMMIDFVGVVGVNCAALPPGRLFGWTILGLGLAVTLGGLSFTPVVRWFASRFLPLDPYSFVHATALATVVGLTVACFVPLLAMNTPPLLLVLQAVPDLDFRPDEFLRSELYGLIWLVPTAAVAVGYPLARSLKESLQRVGMVKPRWRQVVFALAMALLLLPVMQGADHGILWLWHKLGWPITDEKAVKQFFKFAHSPLGAIVTGTVAGLGEELAVRGVLQPRLGLVLSNLFFTSLHAFQYHFDGLLNVFLIGLVFGLIRKRTNTSTSAITHGVYDFLLFLLTYLEVL